MKPPSLRHPPTTGGTDAPPKKPPGAGKQRVDVLLVSRGLAPSRAKAQALVLAGEVYQGEERVDKPGLLLAADAELSVRARQKYVSRGGLKLEGALEDLAFDPAGLRAADVGASTGGFTDCLLQRGAEHVYAIDVGHGQLAQRLADDPRVTVLDRTNARYLEPEQVGGGVDLVVVDASFISLAKLLPAVHSLLRPGGHLLALIKPQFEVGRAAAERSRGVIRDPELRGTAIAHVLDRVEQAGFQRLGDCACRVPGPKGNVEQFVLARRTETSGS